MGILKRIWTLGSNQLYDEAMQLFNEHHYSEAITKFEEILAQKQSSKGLHYNLSLVYASQSHRNLGIVLFATGNYREALEEFRKALQLNPDYTELNYFIGVCLNNLGDFKGAIESFTTVLTLDPHNLPVVLRLGVVLHNNKMWEKAAALYQEILLKHPHYADIHYHLGLAYLGQGRVFQAHESFEKALDINPNYVQPRIKAVVAEIYLGKLDAALGKLNGLIAVFPDYADLYYYQGLIAAGRNELQKAMASFMRALQINPSYKEAKIKSAVVYCHLEQFDEGLRELEELLAIDPDDKEVTAMTQAIRVVVSSSAGDKTGGVLTQMLRDRHIIKSIPEFNRSVKINPEVSEMVSVVMNIADEDQSLSEMLIPLVKNHIAEYPDYPDVHNSLGTLYMKVGQAGEAEACFSEAVRLNPEYLNARLNLFYARKSLGKHAEAVRQGEILSAAGVSYPDFSCALAEACLEGSRFEEARTYSTTALNQNPCYAKAHYILARSYEGLGETDRAITQFYKCLEMTPAAEIQELVQAHLGRLEKP
jgi:tetratricopeptide (TPR) repeat protein